MHQFPELSSLIIQSLIEIASFDVIPSGDLMNVALHPPADELANDKFNEVGFENNFMIMNVSTLFLMLLTMLVGVPCLIGLTKPCKAYTCKCSKWLT